MCINYKFNYLVKVNLLRPLNLLSLWVIFKKMNKDKSIKLKKENKKEGGSRWEMRYYVRGGR